MSINCVAISVGNTRTRLGTFIDGQLAADRVVDNNLDMFAQMLGEAHEPIVGQEGACVLMASVNDTVARKVSARVQKTLNLPVHRVEQDLPIPIGRQLDPEAIVGDDRLLNAAAAYDVLKQACAVVDAGTAVTVDFVDGAGTFHGGAILPGVRAMLDALSRGTAQIPEVTAAKPAEPIGHNTVEAVRSGVYHGIRGAVRELVERFADAAGMYPTVVVTGGDAELLFEQDELIDRIVPDLTLRGIGLTLRTALRAGAE